MKGKTHDLNHDLTFSAHTINCVCHSIMSMFRVLGIYNFAGGLKIELAKKVLPLFLYQTIKMDATICGMYRDNSN